MNAPIQKAIVNLAGKQGGPSPERVAALYGL
jgi:hypothetical protein